MERRDPHRAFAALDLRDRRGAVAKRRDRSHAVGLRDREHRLLAKDATGAAVRSTARVGEEDRVEARSEGEVLLGQLQGLVLREDLLCWSLDQSALLREPDELRHLLATVNDRFNARYNGILVNYYASGDDYISDHRDDELGLDPSVGVLTISYGAERTFRVKEWNHAKNAPTPAYARYHACSAPS